MPKVVVYVSVADDRELRAAGLDPAQVVRNHARAGIARALGIARGEAPLDIEAVAAIPVRSPQKRSLRRPVTPALDAVGVSTSATTGKIGVPVVPASELETSVE